MFGPVDQPGLRYINVLAYWSHEAKQTESGVADELRNNAKNTLTCKRMSVNVWRTRTQQRYTFVNVESLITRAKDKHKSNSTDSWKTNGMA